MHAQLDDLLTATYVLVDDFLPKRRGPGRRIRDGAGGAGLRRDQGCSG
jgi:hypothetical protein